MMRLTITGDNILEIRQQLLQAASEIGTGMKAEVPPHMNFAEHADTAASGTVVFEAAVPTPEEPPAQRGRPKSAHLQAVVDIEKASRTFAMQDAVNAISQILAKFGMDHARQTLSEFGVKKVGEMKPELYADFVMHCEKVLE